MNQRQSVLMAFLAINLLVSAAALLAHLPFPWDAGPWALWLVGALVLESSSLPMAEFGRFSTVTLWSVACLGQLDRVPIEVGAALAVWWGGRSLLGMAQRRWEGMFSLAEWSAAQVWLPLGALLNQLGSLPAVTRWALLAISYAGLHRFLYRRLAQTLTGRRYGDWLRLERLLHPMRILALCGSLTFLFLPPELWWVRGSFIPVLLGFHLGAHNLTQVVHAQDVAQQVLETEDRLREALAEKDRARHRLDLSAQERALLEQLVERLSALRDLREVGPLLASLLGPRLQLQSFAFFWSPSGEFEELELLHGESPERSTMQNFRLLGWGEVALRQGLRDQVARVVNPPLLANEPQGVLIPLGAGLLYLGRRHREWGTSEFQWLAWVLQRSQPILENLRVRQRQQQQLVQVQSHTRGLEERLQGQRLLLDAGQRFARHLKIDELWQEATEFLAEVLPLEGCALISERITQWGRDWNEEALRQLASPHIHYLAGIDRERWPVVPGPYTNVVTLPLTVGGVLAVGFGGKEPLETTDLEMLQGIANLFATALARAALHQDVVATHRRLEQSQELWLQTHKSLALAQMSAGVAHELNSPLGAIRLSIESTMLSASETQRKRLQSALESCERAQKIIERLGQMSAQSQREGSASIDLTQVARQVLDQFAPQIRKLQIQVRCEIPPHLVCPLSKEAAENLLVPLFLNAIEALEQVEVARRQLLLRMASTGQEVAWEVLDRGPGIPAENLSRLSEPFFTTKRIGTNVGLGLAIVEQTCRQLGGQLSFESLPQGARFRVSLPL